MNKLNIRFLFSLCVALFHGMVLFHPLAIKAETTLSLSTAIEIAHANDPWLMANQYEQDALQLRSAAAAVLPDPRITLGLANLAADSFQFSQENMTQLRLGVSQLFPKGETLTLQSKKLHLLSKQNPHLRMERRRQIEKTVTLLWLDIVKSEASLRLIENNRSLFEQLVEITEASYSSAYGSTQQQDIVRAQLELSRLEDRVHKLEQNRVMKEEQLSQWLSGEFTEHYLNASDTKTARLKIESNFLPNLELSQPTILQQDVTDNDRLITTLLMHPAVLTVDSWIDVSHTDIELAKQQYKPQWSINAGYAYRADDPSGNNRADLLSIGASFDVPLYTHKKQDKQLQAAVYNKESIKTKKWLLLRKMIADFNAIKVELLQLNQRHDLYQQTLLPQMQAQAESALNAYTNDEADFAEVVRARIDALNAEIDNLNIEVEQHKAIAQLNYYLAQQNKVREERK